MDVYSIHSLRCEHGVMSAQGIDLGQGNPQWVEERAHGNDPRTGWGCRKPMASPIPWRTLPERILQHRSGGTESLHRSCTSAGSELSQVPPAHLPQVCSCSPAPGLLLLTCPSSTGGLRLCLELSWHLAESSGVTGGRDGGWEPCRGKQCEAE